MFSIEIDFIPVNSCCWEPNGKHWQASTLKWPWPWCPPVWRKTMWSNSPASRGDDCSYHMSGRVGYEIVLGPFKVDLSQCQHTTTTVCSLCRSLLWVGRRRNLLVAKEFFTLRKIFILIKFEIEWLISYQSEGKQPHLTKNRLWFNFKRQDEKRNFSEAVSTRRKSVGQKMNVLDMSAVSSVRDLCRRGLSRWRRWRMGQGVNRPQ